jgi:hypothetical protein
MSCFEVRKKRKEATGVQERDARIQAAFAGGRRRKLRGARV